MRPRDLLRLRSGGVAIPLALALVAAFAVATPAAATGPGTWDNLGTGASAGTASLNGTVSALHTVGTTTYVGGRFTNAGGLANADSIARWSGTTWSALGTGIPSPGVVNAIAHYGSKIYVGGVFQNAGGNADADNLAVFNGTSWAPFCDQASHAGPPVNDVMAFQVIGSTLYVGGASQNGAGFETADYLLACDLINGTPSSTVSTDGDFTGAVYALAADSNGLLYAGGTFSNLDGMATADHVASYDGAWHPVGTAGVSGIVRALATAGTDLYVSTDMLNIDGQANADHIAKWNGSAWSPLGGNTANNNGWFPTSAYIYSIKTSGALVFVAGSFLNANGVAKADNVAYFDGTAWRPIGSDGAGNGPWIGNGLALTVTYGRLYAAGNFTSAGGNTLAKYVASRSLRLVDALIGYYYGSFVGNNVYTANSAVQSRTMSIARGTSQYFPIIIQNEGFVPTTFSLKGTGSATGYTVTFIDHDTSANITTAVRNGTYVSSVRAPGGQLVVRMVVKLSNTAAATGTFVVTSSAGSAYPKDVVRGVVHAT